MPRDVADAVQNGARTLGWRITQKLVLALNGIQDTSSTFVFVLHPYSPCGVIHEARNLAQDSARLDQSMTCCPAGPAIGVLRMAQDRAAGWLMQAMSPIPFDCTSLRQPKYMAISTPNGNSTALVSAAAPKASPAATAQAMDWLTLARARSQKQRQGTKKPKQGFAQKVGINGDAVRPYRHQNTRRRRPSTQATSTAQATSQGHRKCTQQCLKHEHYRIPGRPWPSDFIQSPSIKG